jgi:hypothetical protein
VPGLSPVIELVNGFEAPSIVLVDNAVVGFAEVLQQTPRAETEAPPSDEIVPPLEAVVVVIEEAVVVVSVGIVTVVKEI